MITVTLYYRPDCPHCSEAETALKQIQESIPHQLVKINVESNPELAERMADRVPIVEAGPYRLQDPFTAQDLKVTLAAAQDRMTRLDGNDKAFQERYQRGHTLTGTDRFSHWLSHHYMVLFNLFVFFYIGLPFLAPVFMKINWQGPAKVIYTIYSPLCHQLAFRSFFLFGEQPYYPRSLAGINGVITYEELTRNSNVDLVAARAFLGNAAAGYKVALCERDVAIYGSMLLFGIVFAVTGKRLKSIPWYVWILVGMIPMGIDGGSQFLSLIGNYIPLPFAFPARESTPFLRVLTGSLFGITTAWYIYPLIEETMRDTRSILVKKFAVVEQTQPKSEINSNKHAN